VRMGDGGERRTADDEEGCEGAGAGAWHAGLGGWGFFCARVRGWRDEVGILGTGVYVLVVMKGGLEVGDRRCWRATCTCTESMLTSRSIVRLNWWRLDSGT
jgi:hypothetical protein